MTERQGPPERVETQPQSFTAGINIKIPTPLNPWRTGINLHASRPDAEYVFTIPQKKSGKEDVSATRRNLARAMRRRRPVEVSLADQREGDVITVIYAGQPRLFYRGWGAISECYRYTNKSGWNGVAGGISFKAAQGPNVQ